MQAAISSFAPKGLGACLVAHDQTRSNFCRSSRAASIYLHRPDKSICSSSSRWNQISRQRSLIIIHSAHFFISQEDSFPYPQTEAHFRPPAEPARRQHSTCNAFSDSCLSFVILSLSVELLSLLLLLRGEHHKFMGDSFVGLKRVTGQRHFLRNNSAL